MGMSFQELISQDIKNVFLNPGEFGTRHMVNQRPMCIIIDENELTEREKKQFGRGRDGIYHKSLLFYVSGKDFGPLPSPEQVILLDRIKYLVKEAVDEDGIYSISLEAGRA